MDGGEGGYLSRRTHSGICGRSTTGTRSRRGDVPARRRGGGELSHGAESAPIGATCIRHGRTILDAVRAEEPARRRVVLGGRDFRSQYETAVGYAGGFPAPARPANHGVVGRPSRSRKTTGISHSCFVLRTEIPASEYDTSPGRFFSSDGVQYRPPVSDASCSNRRRFCSV